jgi:uncharacterized protein (DUF1800 family)
MLRESVLKNRPLPFAASMAEAGDVPTLARLAYNRLGFGPRPNDLDFGNDWTAFVSYVDSQLDYESIDDSAAESSVNALDRHDSVGLVMPPLDATPRQIKEYNDSYEAKTNGNTPEDEIAYFLATGTYARALLSKRQLFEMIVDFWTNHFNTLPANSFKAWEDHYVIRQYALGRFRDLLGADAKSPVMLEYLSNAYSDGSDPNENYGREVMELHTLGSVNRIPGHPWNGKFNYTEEDVHTAAQIFSGWTTLDSQYGEFRFNDTPDYPAHHYPAKRIKLDHDDYVYDFLEGGIEQGEKLLDILAGHESTAYRISWKLCRRLISDTAEAFCPGAIEAGMKTFLNLQGDIRATLRAILLYQEDGHDFKSSWGQKIKRPFEFFISALRAMNVFIYPLSFSADDASELYDQQTALGQQLFYWPPPTGYPDVQRAWWNTNQAFARWTLGNLLVQRTFGGQTDDSPAENHDLDMLIGNTGQTSASATQVVDRLVGYFIGHSINGADRTALVNYLGEGNATAPITSAHHRIRSMMGALIASPYFQWR